MSLDVKVLKGLPALMVNLAFLEKKDLMGFLDFPAYLEPKVIPASPVSLVLMAFLDNLVSPE